MLTAKSLGYVLPEGRALFNNLNFSMGTKKYGLVGSNGVGKTTFVRLLARELDPSQGQLVGDTKVFFLTQFEVLPQITLGEYLIDIWESPFGNLQAREELLADLDLSRSLGNLSGGEWMRARLVKAMTLVEGLLILDEPTNNLDREGREVLYRFVKNYEGALLVISHDRELLAEVDEIWELSNLGVSFYGGAFSFYEEMKILERERLSKEVDVARKAKKKQEREHQDKLDRQEKRIRWGKDNLESMGLPRIIAQARKRQAQVSLGRIDKDETERDLAAQERFKELQQQQKKSSQLRLDFSGAKKPKGKVIFSFKDFNFKYPGADRFLWERPVTLTLYSQERLALKGGNGTGKTTLLRFLTSQYSEKSGALSGGYSAITRRFVYLDQDYSLLKTDQTVLENVLEGSSLDQTEVRNRLADYGFYAEEVFKKAEVLSGGERLRACLAKLAMAAEAPQVVILDEPTNNLDLESLAILEKSLNVYEGSLIVVSHDQTFLERVGCGQVLNLCQHKKTKLMDRKEDG